MSEIQFLIRRRPMRSYSSWGTRHHCPMEVGACGVRTVVVVMVVVMWRSAPCLVTSRPLRKIFLAAPFPPPSLLSLVTSPSYPSPPHNQSPVPCWLRSGKKIGAFSFKSCCDKTTGI